MKETRERVEGQLDEVSDKLSRLIGVDYQTMAANYADILALVKAQRGLVETLAIIDNMGRMKARGDER